jgi:ketosteroid isomerase-like protein
MTDYLAAAKRGDWDTAFGHFAEDIAFHIPGRSAFAGDARGKDRAIAYVQSIRDHYRDGDIELELIDMLVSDERVALLVRERFLADGRWRSGVPTSIACRGTRSWRSRSSRPIRTSSTSCWRTCSRGRRSGRDRRGA